MPSWNKPRRVIGVLGGALWRLAIGGAMLYGAVHTKRVWLGACALAFGYYGAVWLRAAVPTLRSREARLLSKGAGQRRALRAPDAYRSSGRGPLSPRELYADVLAALPLPKVGTRPGSLLAHRLAPRDAVGLARDVWIGMAAIAVCAAVALDGWLESFAPFVVAGLLLSPLALALLIKSAWLRARSNAAPAIEVSQEPAFIGEAIELCVIDRERPIDHVVVDLVCEERVRRPPNFSFDHQLANVRVLEQSRNDGALASGSVTATLELPSELPASFRSEHNEISWFLRVRARHHSGSESLSELAIRALPKPVS
jgi:hypothetical protein